MDFLTPATSHNPLCGSLHHRILLSNYFAPPKALALGKTEEQVHQVRTPSVPSLNPSSVVSACCFGGTEERLVLKRKLFMGNWPSNTLFFPLFTPATLGSFIALYEHKIFTQGLIRASTYLVHPMGVELGKILTKNILAPLDKPADIKGHTSSKHRNE
ncbi:hypothetical protein HETIRDRAFT_68253 [Heterobasidion irregulare TC 32-1]|uniref:Glucose-6-phosphate isomerase n=1 Tax=Heterobasidion irregulare (strain TC 32-1) TaxID=747525 RepID=W4K9K4_HETIT|nr:uncharacterized protein HETIRDRAFT_68253 [Heterobasidion irregulare TC 32-1]ETW82419.1 hypothetical protein HETIRDRAFT_68253 [Heterobasidion irregulare TC 32-1]